MSCVVNRSGALVGEAFSVVGEPFVDPGVEPNFLLMVLWSSSSRFSQAAGVPMLCGPFGDHCNGFRFVSADFCCQLP